MPTGRFLWPKKNGRQRQLEQRKLQPKRKSKVPMRHVIKGNRRPSPVASHHHLAHLPKEHHKEHLTQGEIQGAGAGVQVEVEMGQGGELTSILSTTSSN